jgi:OmpA-OmpF porin, OOP family
VEDFLIKEGLVSSKRLTKIGYGETNPADYEASPQILKSKAAKANMRVLFEIIVK